MKPQTRQEIRNMAKPKSYSKYWILFATFLICLAVWVVM